MSEEEEEVHVLRSICMCHQSIFHLIEIHDSRIGSWPVSDLHELIGWTNDNHLSNSSTQYHHLHSAQRLVAMESLLLDPCIIHLDLSERVWELVYRNHMISSSTIISISPILIEIGRTR